MSANRQSGPGILFDMDGVLVDSNPVHRRVIEDFCSRHGKEVSGPFFLKNISGRTNREWIPLLFP